MKKITLLFLFVFALFSAQTQRFTYEYKFIPDSTNKAEMKKEMMLLDIKKNGSSYYSLDKFEQDSLIQAQIQKQLSSGSGNINIQRTEKKASIEYKVSKEYPDFKTYLITSLGQDKYKIAEDQKIVWKVLPDKQKIGSYDAQKATTSFGGREWTAWFSTELPFQDGPYKFYGLPGLIVKITDKKGDFDMTLMGNKTIPEQTVIEKTSKAAEGLRIFSMGGKEINVTEKQFKKVWKDYLHDPAKNIRQMMSGAGSGGGMGAVTVFKMKDQNGKELDQNEMFKSIEKRVKENEAKNNNKIEPDLYN